jgi:hypothetical protein
MGYLQGLYDAGNVIWSNYYSMVTYLFCVKFLGRTLAVLSVLKRSKRSEEENGDKDMIQATPNRAAF